MVILKPKSVKRPIALLTATKQLKQQVTWRTSWRNVVDLGLPSSGGRAT
jgi:hypothetical protein